MARVNIDILGISKIKWPGMDKFNSDKNHIHFISVQFSSVVQSCLNVCKATNCSTPGFPVQHQLLEPTQAHVHHVSDATQPSHLLSSPSPHVFNLSQHQSLFKWVISSHHVAKVLEFKLQHQSFQRIFRTDFLYFFFNFILFLNFTILYWFCQILKWLICCISLQSKGLSRVFSNTTVQKHHFFSYQLYL